MYNRPVDCSTPALSAEVIGRLERRLNEVEQVRLLRIHLQLVKPGEPVRCFQWTPDRCTIDDFLIGVMPPHAVPALVYQKAVNSVVLSHHMQGINLGGGYVPKLLAAAKALCTEQGFVLTRASTFGIEGGNAKHYLSSDGAGGLVLSGHVFATRSAQEDAGMYYQNGW